MVTLVGRENEGKTLGRLWGLKGKRRLFTVARKIPTYLEIILAEVPLTL